MTTPLLFFDFDSTIITKESFDEVIVKAFANHPEKERLCAEVESITHAGMNGDLDFRESLLRRFTLTPLPGILFDDIGEMLTKHITEGMGELITTLQKKEVAIFFISGGFKRCLLPVAKTLGILPERVFANTFTEDKNGFTKEIDLNNPLSTSFGKGEIITQIKAKYEGENVHSRLLLKTILIGDGANDLNAYTSGKVDAFCGFGGNVFRPKIQAQAPAYAKNTKELKAFLEKSTLRKI